MTEESKHTTKTMWNKVLQWIGALTLIIGLPTAGLNLLDRWNQKHDKLIAIVESSAFKLPPAFETGLKEMNQKLSKEAFLTEFKQTIRNDDQVTQEAVMNDLAHVSSSMVTSAILEAQYSKYFYAGGLTTIRVTNQGSTTLDGVLIRIPGVIGATWTKDGYATTQLNKESVDLGEMRVGDTVTITAWTLTQTRLITGMISITHKGGAGTVEYREDGFYHGLFDSWPLKVLLFIALVMMALSGLSNLVLQYKRVQN